MKILWIINKIMPYPANKLGLNKNHLGGWLDNLMEMLSKTSNIELGVVSFYSGDSLFKCQEDNTTYYLIPHKNPTKYNKKTSKYWLEINNDFCADIIHIHGTEYPLGLECMETLKNKKYIISLQGFTKSCSDLYYGGMNYKEILKNMTIRDLLRRDTIFDAKRKFKKRSQYENRMINMSNYVIGRTDWDYSNALAINPRLKYYHLDETIRNEFYNHNWDYSKIEKNSLIVSQGYYPLKGLHQLIKALNIVSKDYPNFKLYVTGINQFQRNTIMQKIKATGYSKFILSLIKKYKLEDNIEFTGMLNEKELIKLMLKTHIMVVPSIVENESNALTEAHIIGVPSIVAFSGGMTNRIEHKKTGFAYPFYEYTMLATYIKEYFSNNTICEKFSKEAKKIALARNTKNIDKLIYIYE